MIFTCFLFFATQAQIDFKRNPSNGNLVASTEELRIYPNPVIDYLELSNPNGQVNSLIVYNLVGRPVENWTAIKGKNTYDVSELSKGMYLIQLLDGRGKVIQTKRINKR